MVSEQDRYQYAKEKFLSTNLELQKELQKLDQVHADHIGISIIEYRQHELNKAFNYYAKSIGKKTYELVIDLCANNVQERTQMLVEHHKSVADAIGMEWAEYKLLNKIQE